VVLTYGGLPLAPHLIRRVRRQGARVVFALHNFSHLDPTPIREADAFRVPSEFARRAYRERAGLEAEAVEYPRNLGRVLADRVAGRYVTFVNPQPVKGVAWFARIALEVGIARPDIHFLVVEGRGGVRWLDRVPADLGPLQTLHGMHTTPFPRDFYGVSRVVLMPSLWEETFGRVAAEALANGIPVLASDRGALPETLGGAGFVFPIPGRYTATDLTLPSAVEAAPWLETIERLWDDDVFYDEHRAKALERAKAWERDRLRPGVEAFFRRVANGDVPQPISSGV
jgi:glycosyltransferase involved in cell wall biosynthesis